MATVEKIKQAQGRARAFGAHWKARRKNREVPCPEFCLNCGTKASKYCPECGQENTPHTVHMGDLVRDVWDEFIRADNKFFRTIISLLFKPGLVTKQYAEGKRKRYLSPMSLYLTVSALFFFLLSQQAPQPKRAKNVTFGQSLREAGSKTEVVEAPPKTKPGTGKKGFTPVASAGLTAGAAGIPIEPDAKRTGTEFIPSPVTILRRKIDWRALPEFADEYQMAQAKLPAKKRDDWLANWISRRIIVFKGYTRQTFFDHVLEMLPKIMFVNMPLFALVLKLLYFRSRRRYVEHFIFSLHVFTVYFVIMSLLFLMPNLGKMSVLLVPLLLLALPVYLFLAMKTMYGQGTPKTLLKLFLLWQLYGFIQFFAGLAAFLVLVLF